MGRVKLTIAIKDLQVGQRFSWIPAHWYGPALLTSKRAQVYDGGEKWDLKYDVKVVNPPGIDYGVDGNIRVRLLAPIERVPPDGTAHVTTSLCRKQ